MHTSLQITFRNLDRSLAVEEKIRERAARLEHYFGDIMSCRVAVELLHKHHRQGNHFHVRIDLTVPGDELVSSREPDDHHAYTDVYVAIRDAFDTMDRMLEEHVRRMRRQVKTHETPLHGRVSELHRADDYGLIESSDGRLVYFHRNSLVDGDFDELALGSEVRFDEEQGERGPQASTVHLVGKHHIVG
jgi:ribosomal subunit interface protein